MADEPLVIKGTDRRSQMYDKIAKVHKGIVEAKWRAKTAGVQMQIQPILLVHLEESLAFLAEELLALQGAFESELSIVMRQAMNEAFEKLLKEHDHAPM